MEVLKGKSNKAIVYPEPGSCKTEIVELPIEAPGPGQVLIRMLYSGVCGTDYSLCIDGWKAILSVPQGQIGGHEGVGEVAVLGPGVTYPAIGSRVGVKYNASACLSCQYCLRGVESECPAVQISGMTTPGTFQQYCLSNANYVTLIPDSVPEDALPGFAPLMCAGITVYAALKRSGLYQGDWVAIPGAGGGLGHLAIQYAKSLGYRVLALDMAEKEKFCKDMGADTFVDVFAFDSDEKLCQHVKSITGNGVQAAIVCASSNRAYSQAIGYMGATGTVVCLGMPDGVPVPISTASAQMMIGAQLCIIGVKSGNRLDGYECVNLAARGIVKCHYQLRKMQDLTKIFQEMEEGKVTGRVVLDLR